ncbi:MAG TPA: hypothetical protein VKS24_11405 [Bradyrhizobium sp.]|nr:hypothetical protein [Bradyrhizobium sp.]
MKAPTVLVTAALTAAILLAVFFLIATETRGESALSRASNSAPTLLAASR